MCEYLKKGDQISANNIKDALTFICALKREKYIYRVYFHGGIFTFYIQGKEETK